MKRCIILTFILCFILTITALSRGETTPEEPAQAGVIQGGAPPSELPKNKARTWGVALGLRSTYFSMTQNTGKIIGHVNLLDEEQNYWPLKPVVQVNLSKYFALEFGYDQFKASALNGAFDIYSEHDKRFSDGTVEWAPYMLALQFRWPHFHKSFVPYVFGGVSYTKTSWSRRDWYYYGFPYPWVYDEWVSQGNRPQDYPNAGYRRIFAVDDHTIGTLLGIGADYFIWKNLALNIDCRYHWAKVNFTYTLAYNEGRDIIRPDSGTFILDSWILGLGLKYFF